MKIYDTIAAVSTPHGKGGVAMIRISGQRATEIADSVFFPKNKTKLSDTEVGKTVYGEIFTVLENGEREHLDEGMAVRFAAPRSFTGEDTVEISCHGGILVTRAVLSAVLSAGARHAEAGEFTRRAFINGKMKLNEAEALGYLLEAKTESQRRIASSSLRGALTKKTEGFYEALRKLLASVYAKIDFPDEDLADMSEDEMAASLKAVLSDVEKLAATYRTGRAINEGIKTVICGRTNAGKSSVYNRLAGKELAIVTDVEGTTRDVLSETVSTGKTTLLISDTAGLRKTEDKVESIGIERTLAEIGEAELALAVFDSTRELSEDDRELINKLCELDVTTIALLNKSDVCAESALSPDTLPFPYTVSVSAKGGDGFDKLYDIIDSLFIDGEIDIKNDAVVADARQYSSLIRTAEAIRVALASIEGGTPLDLCCIDIETAMAELGELEGREIGEDIVSEIFSKFCVGK